MCFPRSIPAVLVAVMFLVAAPAHSQPSFDLNLDGLVDVGDVVYLVDRINGDLPSPLTVHLPGNVPMEMVRIPPGTFVMGSLADERSRADDEGPTQTVTITNEFYVSKTEITQGQWLALMGSWPGAAPDASNGQGAGFPAYNVSWFDAINFTVALNALMDTTGQAPSTFRLLTEAEWEYACRAGTQTRFFFGDSLGADDFCNDAPGGLLPGYRTDYMWYCGNNGIVGSKEVQRKLSNQFGLHDMAGNVWEWCYDVYDTYPGGLLVDPTGPTSGTKRVRRGGAWYMNVDHGRSANRERADPTTRSYAIGFRVCFSDTSTPPPPPPVGAVEIDVTPDAGSWTLSGPGAFGSVIGTGDRLGASVFKDAPAGDYTLVCDDNVVGFDPPASETLSLSAGETATFRAVYGTEPPMVAMVSVPAGTFTMGRRDDGDDGLANEPDELPRHDVTLSAYRFGEFQVTNAQYSEVLNWGLGLERLENSAGGLYAGGDVWLGGQILLEESSSYCQIDYNGAAFTPETRTGQGGALLSMATHPAVMVSWHGAAAFCNWLSTIEGLTPAYDLDSWELVDTDAGTTGVQFTDGYRLPTEAEWERAAAWDGSKHWIYGLKSDTLSGSARCNYKPSAIVNPLGLTTMPHSSPVGWFDGVNISPNGGVQTINSPSPAGTYDMCGNVYEWCHDRYDAYSSASQTNPTGPTSGTVRVLRGGSWFSLTLDCRSAWRTWGTPDPYRNTGFRVARAPLVP